MSENCLPGRVGGGDWRKGGRENGGEERHGCWAIDAPGEISLTPASCMVHLGIIEIGP